MTLVGDGLNSPRKQGGNDDSVEVPSPFPDKYVLRNTRILKVSRAQITEVPMEVFELARQEQVNIVRLDGNHLMELPRNLTMLSELLYELDVAKNEISYVPTYISQFSILSILDLSCNLLCELPMELAGLQLLNHLDISYNRFKQLPRCIYELECLETLLAQDNKIKEIDASDLGLGGMKQLIKLNLMNNDLQTVPPTLGNLRNLQELELWGNPFRQPRHQILSMGTAAVLRYLRTRIPSN
ncbi:leucine-rich repeat-containing protein 40 [Drosophila bipectinata]|uniref:leucine-rich repeat-containing protein 40 n=1 Tax=Drosophila bipectinata TaxID=42026 RepID=UPI001C8AEC72|nr:leucine-rich repeat-containing protein 40 [Drosophila bipectinata]